MANSHDVRCVVCNDSGHATVELRPGKEYFSRSGCRPTTGRKWSCRYDAGYRNRRSRRPMVNVGGLGLGRWMVPGNVGKRRHGIAW
jgi:hypothetical protein